MHLHLQQVLHKTTNSGGATTVTNEGSGCLCFCKLKHPWWDMPDGLVCWCWRQQPFIYVTCLRHTHDRLPLPFHCQQKNLRQDQPSHPRTPKPACSSQDLRTTCPQASAHRGSVQCRDIDLTPYMLPQALEAPGAVVLLPPLLLRQPPLLLLPPPLSRAARSSMRALYTNTYCSRVCSTRGSTTQATQAGGVTEPVQSGSFNWTCTDRAPAVVCCAAL